MATENSAIDALKGILGDNADEKIQAVMQGLSGNSTEKNEASQQPVNKENVSRALSALGGGNAEYLMQIKSIVDQLGNSRDDPRSNLLMSLRPYMRGNRQKSIDSAVKMLNLTKLSGLLKLK